MPYAPFGLRHLLQVGEPRSFFKRGNLANELLSAQRSGLPCPIPQFLISKKK